MCVAPEKAHWLEPIKGVAQLVSVFSVGLASVSC